MNSRLLMATVGGSPEPLVASLLHWRPARVVFIVTPQTRDSVPGAIVPDVQANDRPEFDAGRHDLHIVPNIRNYTGFATASAPSTIVWPLGVAITRTPRSSPTSPAAPWL